MRSAIVLIITIVLSFAGFLAYFALQPKVAPQKSPAHLSATTAPIALPQPTTQSGSVAGSGEDVWIKTYDEKTGRLAFQLRAARYDPLPDGNAVEVAKPQAELFMGEAPSLRVLRIEGARGRVVMPSDAVQRGQIRGQDVAPRRGELHDVLMTLFDASDMSAPILTCKVNNVSFDNDTYRISTETYKDAGGIAIPADEVPIEIRGQDYDFDGRGLTIKWNGVDRRLALLEIAHGERLVVKSAQATSALAGSEADARRAETKSITTEPAPVLGKPQALEKPTTARSAGVVYRATFADEVRITQDQQAIALADQMLVDFLESNSAAEPRIKTPSTQPAQRTRAAPAQPRDTASPILVRWVGKLRVAPRDATDAPLPLPGKFDVALFAKSQPIMLNFRGSQISCASVEHRSADDSAIFRGSPQIPQIVLRDSGGAVLYTPAITFIGAEGKAISKGPSHGDFPVENEKGKPAGVARLQWTDSCLVTFAQTIGKKLTIGSADVRGAVNLQHPQLKLNSDAMMVDFKPDESGPPALRSLVATGTVQASMLDSQEQSHSITSNRLELTTAQTDKRTLMVKTLKAEGDVHAFDAAQELYAGTLDIAFAPEPSAQPAPQPADAMGWGKARLESLLAQQDVRISTRDGWGATADRLRITGEGEDQFVEVLGQPRASIYDGANTVVGQLIKLQPKRQQMEVAGPGTLHGVQRAENAPERSVDVEWSSGMTASGQSNLIEITGDVRASSESADGSTQHATAQKLTMTLIDADGTRDMKPVDNPADAQAMNPMHGKQLGGMTLSNNARIALVMPAEGETRGRREVHLFGEKATYDAKAGRFTVPSAGKMLVRDDTPTTQPAQSPAGNPVESLRGATAFEWRKELIFDENSNRATMSDQVVIVHQDFGAQPRPFRLEAAEVAADLLPTTDSVTQPTEARLLPGASEFRVNQLTASGGVRFTSQQIQFDADQLEYSPPTEILVARGTERNPAQLYDDRGVSKGTFEQLWYNTRTEQIRLKNPQAQIRR